MQESLLTLCILLLAYLVGGVSVGFWLVRLKTGKDIREQGSGTTGATNAGRVLGGPGFVLVFLGDALKGACVAILCQRLLPTIPLQVLGSFAAIAGHIWPIQLRFRGGKGISTFIGAWLVLCPLVLLPSLLLALLVLAVLRRFTISGLIGLIVFPFSAFFLLNRDPWVTAIATASLLVLLYAHRNHIARFKSDFSK